MAKAKTRLSGATYVKNGYGQVEGNKLSARYNGKIFASLPCDAAITKVENGMFLVYDYANRKVALPTADGMEPMLVFNEVKVYESRETDADFAMLAENYDAYVYNATADGKYAHVIPGTGPAADRTAVEYDNVSDMTKGEPAIADVNLNPYGMMGDKVNSIVPRLFKTDVGDIMTTNCVKETELKIGDKLHVGTDGYLAKAEGYTGMEWTVVNVYTMPDLQPGVKLMRTK